MCLYHDGLSAPIVSWRRTSQKGLSSDLSDLISVVSFTPSRDRARAPFYPPLVTRYTPPPSGPTLISRSDQLPATLSRIALLKPYNSLRPHHSLHFQGEAKNMRDPTPCFTSPITSSETCCKSFSACTSSFPTREGSLTQAVVVPSRMLTHERAHCAFFLPKRPPQARTTPLAPAGSEVDCAHKHDFRVQRRHDTELTL